MNTVLIIDNDLKTCKEIKYNLQDETTDVYYTHYVEKAIQMLQKKSYTLVILDTCLSQVDGMALIEQIRQMHPLPILALSESADTADRVAALKCGADDLLNKPYDLKECLARAQALIRRYTELNHIHEPSYSIVSCGSLIMNPEQRTAFFKGSPMNLTRKEYDMLRLLAENPGRVFTYEQIFDQVWNEEYVGSANTISKHVSRLRKKEPGLEIEAVHDLGYRLNPKDD